MWGRLRETTSLKSKATGFQRAATSNAEEAWGTAQFLGVDMGSLNRRKKQSEETAMMRMSSRFMATERGRSEFQPQSRFHFSLLTLYYRPISAVRWL